MAEAALAWDETNDRSSAPEDHRLHLRMLEAILFASANPLSRGEMVARMPEGVDMDVLLHELQAAYAGRGVVLPRTPALANTIGERAEATAARGFAGPPHAVRPLYVRRPDAELARERGRPVSPSNP